MSLPTTLGDISTASTAWGSDFEYRHKSSVTGYEIYDLWKISHSNWFNVAAGYSNPDAYSIKVDTSNGTWSDNAPTNDPLVDASNSTYVILSIPNGDEKYRFTKPSYFSSGPTVTSITNTTIFVPSDTVSNTDFTLLKNGSAYANTNISLTGPGAQPPSDARGYTYALTYSGTAWYNTTIDSKTYDNFYYDDSWRSSPSSYTGRSTNSNRILNVLGKIPNSTIMTWTGSTTLTKDTGASSDYEIRWYSSNGGATGTERNMNYGMYVTGQGTNIVAIMYAYSHGYGLNITYSSPFTVGAQATMSYTAGGNTVSVQDWVYSAEPEGDGYAGPVTTTSNGGGRPDRYPLIMTNLFNRNRSLYSIGMTHKDTWDLFL